MTDAQEMEIRKRHIKYDARTGYATLDAESYRRDFYKAYA